MKTILLFLCIVLILFSCKQTESKKETVTNETLCTQNLVSDDSWYTSGKKAPLLPGLEGIDFPISTQIKEAQDYFNQGLMLAYAFNHAEAARSFFEASRLDPNCAMAYWGYAYVLGPNYNAVMPIENHTKALKAISKADSLQNHATDLEKALIQALKARYPQNPIEDAVSLDQIYAHEMKKVYEQFPENPDVGALYAESLMNLHPWDLYEKNSKDPKPWTVEIVGLLENLMKKHSKHPGAHHFYIHAMEASAHPEKALKSADLLNTLVPGAGHLVHMPSHIYINTGDYHLGTIANQNAVKVDSIYTTSCHAQGVYPLAYYPHNYHFLAATATLEGDSKTAWAAAKKVQEHTASQLMDQPGWGTLQHYYIIPLYVGVKLELWDEILAYPSPSKNLVYPTALHSYAKGMAYLGKNDLNNAEIQLIELKKLAKNKILNETTIWDINTSADLVKIAQNVLEAGIKYKRKNYPEAIELLQTAIEIEDSLNYNEPPDWFFSVRHYLGNLYLNTKNYKEAEQIFREDLKTWKKNGWALHGLMKALEGQNKTSEMNIIREEFKVAWKFADFQFPSSKAVFM